MITVLSGGPRKYRNMARELPDGILRIDMDTHADGIWCRTAFKNSKGYVIFAYVRMEDLL
jgi:hypothetical protein